MGSDSRLQPLYTDEPYADSLPPGWSWKPFDSASLPISVGRKFDKKAASEESGTPVIDQSKDGTIGFHREKPGVICDDASPVFTFANHTCAMRWMTRDFSCIQNVFAFRAPDGINLRYLYYASLGRVVLEEYKGHAPIFRSMYIPIAPEAEQGRIASMLSVLDDRIDLLRQTNATLEAIAQALFKSWFVDFDPVRAKAEGREPEAMDAATAALFPSEFEESELGSIPKGWFAKSFGSLLDHSIGGDWGSETPTDEQTEEIAIIRGTDIPDLRSQASCRVPIRYTTLRKISSRTLAAGDLIVEVSGGSKDQPTGRSLYLTEELLSRFDCSVVPASFCRKFSPSSPQVGLLLAQHMDFIYAAGRTWEYQNQSTGIANFQTKHFLANEHVVVPSDAVLDAFFKIVRPIAERTQLSQARHLTDLRDTLLPRLISGKLRLPDVQTMIEEATP